MLPRDEAAAGGILERHSRWVRYGAAVLLIAGVTLSSHELDAVWDTALRHPYLVEWPAVVAAAWLGGLGPGLVATALSTAGIVFYWIEPARSLRIAHPSDVVAVVLYALLGVVVTLLIDRLHRARAEERRLRRSREILLGVVAHDLRNPLGTIGYCTELLRRKPGDARRLDAIDRATSRMERLIRDLLDASVLETGVGLTMVFDDEDVGALVAEAVVAATPGANAKGITVAAEVSGTLRARCDRERMLQVLGNLLGNAVKFTPEQGRITVRAVPLGSFVRLEVTDTGPGIRPEEQSLVFDRSWTGRAPGSGAGLGLFIARGIVRGHGGRIWLHSEQGHGTSFFLTVPAAASGVRPPADSARLRLA